ncbi:MAG: TIM barrel protein [Betaproteobacteria bacterium]
MERQLAIALSLEKTGFGPVLFGGEPERGMRLLAELGYSAVELSIRDSTKVDRSWLRRLLDENRLSLSGIATGQTYYTDGHSLASPAAAGREVAVARLKGHIDLAAEFGAVVIIGGVRGTLAKEPRERESQWRAFVEAVGELADYAAARGVRLALEPINRYETNLINTVGEGLDLLEQVGRGNLGLLVDTFHMNIEEASLAKSICRAGSALLYVHLADSNRWAPGMGHLRFGEVFRALDRIGYLGPLSAEILPQPTAEKAASAAARFLKEAMER